MSGYGVDTPSWTPLPWSWAAERLATTKNFWLITVAGDGRPHAMPVWGVWDDDELRFCFSCAPSARKARNLAADPRAVVTTSDTVECVSVEGAASPVSADATDRWIDRYLTKYRPEAPDLGAAFLLRNLLFEFIPERAFGIIEREHEFAERATRWVFA